MTRKREHKISDLSQVIRVESRAVTCHPNSLRATPGISKRNRCGVRGMEVYRESALMVVMVVACVGDCLGQEPLDVLVRRSGGRIDCSLSTWVARTNSPRGLYAGCRVKPGRSCCSQDRDSGVGSVLLLSRASCCVLSQPSVVRSLSWSLCSLPALIPMRRGLLQASHIHNMPNTPRVPANQKIPAEAEAAVFRVEFRACHTHLAFRPVTLPEQPSSHGLSRRHSGVSQN